MSSKVTLKEKTTEESRIFRATAQRQRLNPREVGKTVQMYSICKILDEHSSKCPKQEKTWSKSQVNRETEGSWNAVQRNIQCTVNNQNAFN